MHNRSRSTSRFRVLVHACLDDLDQLVEAFMAELAELAPYRDELIPLPEVRQDAEASFEMLLRLIAEMPMPARLADVSERVGRRRAQAGVPLEILLKAVRLDFRVLWAALVHRAGDQDKQALMEATVTVWEAVERHTVGVHVSYLDEASVLDSEREQERSRMVAKLLGSDGRDAAVRAQVAAALGVEQSARFAVASSSPAHQRMMRRVTDSLRENRIIAHLHQDDERRPVLIAQVPRGARTIPKHWFHGVACGLGPIAAGLAAVPQSVRVAVDISKVLADGTDEPVGIRQVWSEVVALKLSDVGVALADELLADLDPLPVHERTRLTRTAEIYFECGSVATTASTLFCHRNTVLNRLRKLGELTGGDLNSPDHAAAVLLALRIRARCADGPNEI